MRRTHRASSVSAAGLVLGLAACGDSTDPGSSGLSAMETSDIGAAAADEVDQAAAAFTIAGAATGYDVRPSGALLVAGPHAASCATVDNTTDTDGDGAPDEATYTFALPACSFTGFRGGVLEITGQIVLSDPTPNAPDFNYLATLIDFQFKLISPDASRTYTATRNGTRALTGNANGLALSNTITTVRTFPSRPDATINHNLLLTFTPDQPGTLVPGQPLPDGTIEKSGTLTFSRNGVSRTFTITTVEPLVWDADCVTDRKIVSGETHATLGNGSYIRTVWTGCGEDPERTFVE